MRISIIIPTRNSEITIGLALKSILAQGYQDLEVIVVDCHSIDKTIDIVNSFKKRMNIKVLRFNSSTLLARMIGVKASNGEIVMFLDSDHILKPGKLVEIINLMSNGNYDALILEEISCSLSRSLFVHLIRNYRQYVHELLRRYGIIRLVYPRVFRKSALEKMIPMLMTTCTYAINMWDDKILCETLNHYVYENRMKIGFVEEALYHIEPTTVAHLIRKYIKYGKNVKSYTKLLKEYDECKWILDIVCDNNIVKSLWGIPLSILAKMVFNPIFIVKSMAYAIGLSI